MADESNVTDSTFARRVIDGVQQLKSRLPGDRRFVNELRKRRWRLGRRLSRWWWQNPVSIRVQRAAVEREVARFHDAVATTPLDGHLIMIHGALLGWAREGHLLDHDFHDVDLLYFAADENTVESALPTLAAAGFFEAVRWIDTDGHKAGIGLLSAKSLVQFDLVRLDPTATGTWQYRGFVRPPSGVSAWTECDFELPHFDIEWFEFMGRRWKKPADHERILEWVYGDWRTPNPHHDETDDLHRRGTRPCLEPKRILLPELYEPWLVRLAREWRVSKSTNSPSENRG